MQMKKKKAYQSIKPEERIVVCDKNILTLNL